MGGFFFLWVALVVGVGLYVQYKVKTDVPDISSFGEVKLRKAEEGHELKEVAAGRSAIAQRATQPGASMAAPEIVNNTLPSKMIGHDGLVKLSDEEAYELALIANKEAEWRDKDTLIVGPELLPTEVVEVMPQFPGGLGALMKWLDRNVVYPQACIKRHIKGHVEVSFTVEADGTVRDPVVEKKADPLLDKACLLALQRMPRWEPGRDKGRLVRVRMTLPVDFNPD